MKRSFVLNDLKPFSINATYYGNGFIKTSAAREWAMQVFNKLDTAEHLKNFKELRESFDEQKHGFSVSITAYYPEIQFYTKKGLISSKIFDLSNAEKGLIDLLFLPKHALNTAPLGCQNLQIDDRYIIDLVSKKRPTKDAVPRIEIEIELVSRP